MPTNTPSTYLRPTRARRRWLVYTGVVLSVSLYLLMLHYIVGGSWRRPQPTALVAVRGDPSYAGITATLTADGAGSLSPTLVADFDEGDNYVVRMHVVPGDYRLTLSRGKTVMNSYRIHAEDGTIWWRVPKSDMPATEPQP